MCWPPRLPLWRLSVLSRLSILTLKMDLGSTSLVLHFKPPETLRHHTVCKLHHRKRSESVLLHATTLGWQELCTGNSLSKTSKEENFLYLYGSMTTCMYILHVCTSQKGINVQPKVMYVQVCSPEDCHG